MTEPSKVKPKKFTSKEKHWLQTRRVRVPRKKTKSLLERGRHLLSSYFKVPHLNSPDGSVDDRLTGLRKFWRSVASMPVLVGAGIVAIFTISATFVLTHPQSSFLSSSEPSLACQSKLNGQWQTNWGGITFQEKDGSQAVEAQYEYLNFDRGKVKGQLTGNLRGDILSFDWQETAEKGQPLQQGKGTFLFTNDCKDFTGSHGLGNADSGHGSWRGSVLKVVPIAR